LNGTSTYSAFDSDGSSGSGFDGAFDVIFGDDGGDGGDDGTLDPGDDIL
jgi:hypothetical protein